MFASTPTLNAVLQCPLPDTQPSFQTHIEVLLGWVMCLGRPTEYGVFQTIRAGMRVSRKKRRPLDRFDNFVSRSAWTIHQLTRHVAVAVVVALNPHGLLYLVVDDTLLHKRGKHVYGLGWFRDAVALTAKRVATASGNHWVVVALAILVVLVRDPQGKLDDKFLFTTDVGAEVRWGFRRLPEDGRSRSSSKRANT